MTDPDTQPGFPDQLDAALAGAYEGLLPPRADFLRGVRERIEEERERDEARVQRLSVASPRLRWVASILPPGFVAGAAGIAGKKLGLKAVAGVIAMPAIAILVLVGTFVGGVRSLRSATEAYPSTAEDIAELNRDWWRRNRVLAFLSLGLVLLLFYMGQVEALLLLLVLSMVVTVSWQAELARAELLDRKVVARGAGMLLFWMAWIAANLKDALPPEPSGIPVLAQGGILALGGLACFVAGGVVSWRCVVSAAWHPERKMLHPDPVTTFCLRVLYSSTALLFGVFFLALSVLCVGVVSGSLARGILDDPPTPESLARDVERALDSGQSLSTDDLVEASHFISEETPGALDPEWAARVQGELSGRATRLELGDGEAQPDTLRGWLERLRALEAAGGRPELDECASEIRELLPLSWAEARVGHKAFGTELDRTHFWLHQLGPHETARDALALMARVGVPRGLDLDEVRAELEHDVRWSGRILPRPLRHGRDLSFDIAWLYLERLAPREHGVLDGIIDHRLTLGAVLLSLLCLVAVRRAPVAEELS